MFAELLAAHGVEERLVLRSRVGFMAFHGGSLERMTDVIAEAAAEPAGASFYAVVQPDDLRWHVPSKFIDPAASPSLTAFLDHVDVAIALHGYGRDDWWTTILAGGSHRELAADAASEIEAALPDYDVRHELDRIPVELRGLHPDNPVNRCRHGGIQLELPPRVRGLGPYWGDPRPGSDLVPHTVALIEALANLARRLAA